MKAKDCAVATALVLNGYLRANDGAISIDKFENAKEMLDFPLVEALRAIRQECDDWAENLSSNDAALEPSAISVELLEANGGEVSRSPYNLLSGAVALALEAVDLNGPTAIDNLIVRLRSTAPKVASVSIDDLHKSQHPLARANAASWLKKNGGPVRAGRIVAEPKNADESGALVDAANQLSAEIDAATDRPVAKLAALRTIVSALNARGVDVEEVVTAPQNW